MNVVVIGAQWGDEGKGKIVDFLASQAEVIVRFSGGANAGHTIVHEDKTYKLHLIPSGILYPGKRVILGIGMVIDPEALFRELAELEAQGVDWQGRVFVSDRAHLVIPSYRRRDVELDKSRKRPIGTTGRGIGITYAAKANRDGIRVIDIIEKDPLANIEQEDRLFLETYATRLAPLAVNVTDFLTRHKPKRILLEGAQGALLDLDLGTYPFVSSGTSGSAGAALGGGIGPRDIDRVLGVFKAYSTRVGNGPFPTEFSQETEKELDALVRETGREYGVTTGRPRRCGYLDLVALRYACVTNSIDSLVLTHLDVYDTISEIKVCTAYNIDGVKTDVFPSSARALERARPVFESVAGWQQPLGRCRSYDELAAEARRYVEFIENYTGVPVGMVSIGYAREQTIVKDNPWTES
ncbi:MAG TPA: adenylosuccinate synthase [Spirochaetia bacterium]|nr:adenylosuccinate synthase [Spirochaetia bacterium]